jgi:hypothetical protein
MNTRPHVLNFLLWIAPFVVSLNSVIAADWKTLVSFEDASGAVYSVSVDLSSGVVVPQNKGLHDKFLKDSQGNPIRLEKMDGTGALSYVDSEFWVFDSFRYFQGPPTIVSFEGEFLFEVPTSSGTASVRISLEVDRGFVDKIAVEMIEAWKVIPVPVVNVTYNPVFSDPRFKNGPPDAKFFTENSAIGKVGKALDGILENIAQKKWELVDGITLQQAQRKGWLTEAQLTEAQQLKELFHSQFEPRSAYQNVTSQKAANVFVEGYLDPATNTLMTIQISFEPKAQLRHHFKTVPKNEVFTLVNQKWVKSATSICKSTVQRLLL